MSFKWQRYLDRDYMVTSIQSTRVYDKAIEDEIEKFRVSRGFVWHLNSVYATPHPSSKTVFVWEKMGDDD